MKNKLIVSVLALLILVAYGCTDLTEELRDEFTEDFTPDNPGVNPSTNVNMPTPDDGLGAAFGTLFGTSANHYTYFSVQEVSTDEAVITQKGGDWFDGGIWLQMHQHTWTAAHDPLNATWANLYGGVNECNRLIGDGLSVEGEAIVRLVRAYYFWRLLDLFGNIKTPLVDGADVAQSTSAATFDLIESEILDVYGDLPAGRQDYGRPSQGAADALLARLYLNWEVYSPSDADGINNYQMAIDRADNVINDGSWDLDDSYADVFAPDNVDNIEHIWVVPFDEATGGGMNLAQMTFHYPTQLTYNLQQQPWNGYSTLEAFYNSYENGDERKDNNFVVGPQFDLSGNPLVDVAFDPDDPDGAEINYTPAINELAPSGSRQAGARFGKFSHKLGQTPNMDNDYPLFRYGGVLLDKAEAMCRLAGDWNAGTSIVNELRARAGVADFGTMTEADFLAERGRELFIESLRRNDLIRFGEFTSTWWEKEASAPFRTLFPIPQAQINAAADEGLQPLAQNPEY